jgi:hypothetical protein
VLAGSELRRRRLGLLAASAVVVVGVVVALLLVAREPDDIEQAADQDEGLPPKTQAGEQDRGEEHSPGEHRYRALGGGPGVPKLAKTTGTDEAGGPEPEAQAKVRQGSWEASVKREPSGGEALHRVASPAEAEAIREQMKRAE